MTVYNHQEFVKSSIKSILSQSIKNFEFIIINNGSTDSSGKIIRKIKDQRIKFFHFRKNIGRTKCLNFGLKKCKGDYIAIQDSDDISKKNRLKVQSTFLNKNNEIDLVATNYNIINYNSKIINKVINKIDLYKYPKKLIFYNYVAHSTVMYRRKIMEELGFYPENFVYAQDYAFYLKLIKSGKIKLLKNILSNLRINHQKSETFRLRRSLLVQIEELKLIWWVIKNIDLNLLDFVKIFMKFLKVIVKIFRSLFT